MARPALKSLSRLLWKQRWYHSPTVFGIFRSGFKNCNGKPRTGIRLAARTIAGAHIREAAAPMRMFLRVTSVSVMSKSPIKPVRQYGLSDDLDRQQLAWQEQTHDAQTKARDLRTAKAAIHPA